MDKQTKAAISEYVENEQYEEVVQLILALPSFRDDDKLMLELACALNNLERYDDAIQELESVAHRCQDEVNWHNFLGYALYYKHDLEAALASFEKGRALKPKNEFALEYIGMCKRAMERAEYRRAMKARAVADAVGTTGSVPFEGFDLTGFWDDCDYGLKNYVAPSPSQDTVAACEKELGYKLPASYVRFCQEHNGGLPRNTCFPTEIATSWAEDHVAIHGIFGIGSDKPYSICGNKGSKFWIEEWEYPAIGIVICDCPSAGHDVIMLDYRACGPQGEPEVVHVDQESDYEITFLADTFEEFIRGLCPDEAFEVEE